MFLDVRDWFDGKDVLKLGAVQQGRRHTHLTSSTSLFQKNKHLSSFELSLLRQEINA